MRQLILIALVAMVVFACRKQIDVESYWNCHQSQNHDSASITNKLIGSWKWEKRSCLGAEKVTKADKVITLIFQTGGSYSIQEGGTTISQGTWVLRKGIDATWKIEYPSPNEYMHGRILFCDDELLFYNSNLDGCDNLFKRK